MLALSKGKYVGSIRNTVAAKGALVSITEYVENQGVSPMHYHENPHLSFVLRGAMCVKRKHAITSSEEIEHFSFMRSGEMHQTSLQGDYGKNVNLELTPEFFATYGITESEIIPNHVTDHPGSALMMVRLYKEVMLMDQGLTDSIHILLLNTVRTWKEPSSKVSPSWVKNAHELLNDRWNEPVDLSQISKATGVHPVTISKYFSRYFGATLGEYRRKLKIAKAVSMMKSSRSLTEISHECGFFDQSHFIKAFKETTAMLPAEYRRI